MTSPNCTMRIKFWGTRGSYPVPGRTTLEYGGNTSCSSVEVGGRLIIFDAGTGIINLGHELVKQDVKHNIALFLSHNHLDHTAGLLYFKPTYLKSTFMHIYGPTDSYGSTADTLDELTLPPAHPVPLTAMGMEFVCKAIRQGQIFVWRKGAENPGVHSTEVETTPDDVVVRVLHNKLHPVDGVLNFRVEYQGRAYVYATDVEGNAETGDPILAEFAKNADALAHDCQYVQSEYIAKHQGWGHSTPEIAAQTAKLAGVKQLMLLHFEPTYDDAKLAGMEAHTKTLFPNSFFAKEGMEICID